MLTLHGSQSVVLQARTQASDLLADVANKRTDEIDADAAERLRNIIGLLARVESGIADAQRKLRDLID